MITNPEYLSKDRLKSELKSRGIKFNQNENKPYYVRLYRKKVLDVEEGRQEFSSDEELSQRSSRSEKKQSPRKKKTIKMDTYLAEVEELDDEELREELERYGKDVGPITDTTRSIYQSSLARAMAENVTGKSSQMSVRSTESSEGEAPANQSFVGEWSEDDSELEEAIRAENRRPLKKPSPVKPARSTGARHRPAARPPPEPVEDRQDPPQFKPARKRTVPKATSYQAYLVFLLMFAVAFFSYEHYYSTVDDPSLITRGTEKAICTWNTVKAYIVKDKGSVESSSPEPPSKPPPAQNDKTPPKPMDTAAKADKEDVKKPAPTEKPSTPTPPTQPPAESAHPKVPPSKQPPPEKPSAKEPSPEKPSTKEPSPEKPSAKESSAKSAGKQNKEKKNSNSKS